MSIFRKDIFRLHSVRGIGDRVVALAVLLIITLTISATVNSAAGEQQAAQLASPPEPSCTMSVTYIDGLFTVTADQCHLRALLSEMGLKGEIKFEVDASLQERLIKVSFVGKKLEDAIGTILDIAGQKNVAVEYEKKDGKDNELKARRVFLVRRELEDGQPQAGIETQSEQSHNNVIHYSKYRLTVKVKDMDVMELLAAIEKAMNRELKREYRILVNDVIDSRISVDMADDTAENVLDNIIYLLRPMRYLGQIETSYNIPEGSNIRSISAYIIRKLRPEEVVEQDRIVRQYLEAGKKHIEEGAYKDAQKSLGGLYYTDRFNADWAFYTGLNALMQGAPAVDFFKRCLELDPSYSEASYWLGLAYEKEMRLGEAAKAYKEYLARGKNEKLLFKARRNLVALEKAEVNQYYQDLSRAESYQEDKDLPTAERVYQDLIIRDPSRPEAYWKLTVNYVRQRKLDVAYDLLQRATDLQDKDKLLCFVGEAYLGRKEYAKARNVFDDLLRRKPGKDLRDRIEEAIKEMN